MVHTHVCAHLQYDMYLLSRHSQQQLVIESCPVLNVQVTISLSYQLQQI